MGKVRFHPSRLCAIFNRPPPNSCSHIRPGMLKSFAFNLNQIEGKPRQAKRRECCVLHLIC